MGVGHGRAPACALAAVFVASRAAAYAAGVRYEMYVLERGVQILDAGELKEHLARSIWYLHTQPPLFNLFLGLVQKLPWDPVWTLAPLWLGLGALLVVLVHTLLRDLGVRPGLAVAATALITASPVTIVYENNLSYEYPLVVALTGLAVAAGRWATTGRLRWLVACAAVAGAATLTRALLHPLWYVAVVAVLLLARRPTGRWRPAAAALLAPLVLVAAVVAKNQVVLGSPQLSSFAWWNLSRVTVDELTPDRRETLIAEGTLTPMARVGSLAWLDAYGGVSAPCTPAHPDVPVLAQGYKANGEVNLNAECYLPLQREARHNALAAARAEPAYTARTVVGAFQVWGLSSSDFFAVYGNRDHIVAWDTVYRRVVLLDVPYDPPVTTRTAWWVAFRSPDGRWRFSLTIAAATLLAVAAGARSLRRMARRARTAGAHLADPASIGVDAALAVVGVTVLMVTLIGNVFEIGENNRFRVMVEPVTLIVAVGLADRLVTRFQAWRARRGEDPAGGVGSPADDDAAPGPHRIGEESVVA
jgi:hypothetical protein